MGEMLPMICVCVCACMRACVCVFEGISQFGTFPNSSKFFFHILAKGNIENTRNSLNDLANRLD